MKANKDKGTSVGFSKATPESYDGKEFDKFNTDEIAQWDNKPKKLRPVYKKQIKRDINTVCKEHELIEGYKKLLSFTDCPQILIDNPTWIFGTPTDTDLEWAKKEIEDFEFNHAKPIKENLSPTNKLEWEDIWKEWLKTDDYRTTTIFYHWLQKNYFAPEKKI